MTERSTLTRALPMLEIVPPTVPSAPRLPASPADDRLAEYLPEARTLPRFHLWTLGCQMNRSGLLERAGWDSQYVALRSVGVRSRPKIENVIQSGLLDFGVL